MNYFFLAAGCFAFQLLFAYLVDLAAAAAVISHRRRGLARAGQWLPLACAAGRRFAPSPPRAQFAYMVLFSYSFFFDGLTGITITIGAITTLALLMAFTARVNWSAAFTPRAAAPPPIPARP